MVPLLICSIIALAVVIERVLCLGKKRIIRPDLVRLIHEVKDVNDVPLALSKCKHIHGPFANIIKHVLVNLHLSWEEKLHEIQIADCKKNNPASLKEGHRCGCSMYKKG